MDEVLNTFQQLELSHFNENQIIVPTKVTLVKIHDTKINVVTIDIPTDQICKLFQVGYMDHMDLE